MALPDGLLDAVKNYLNITWTDTDTDTNLEGIIARGMSRLNELTGNDALDYTVEGQPRALLFEYCRYTRSGGLADFETNYEPEITHLQNMEEVRAYIAESTDV
jgi:hypothetical protein